MIRVLALITIAQEFCTMQSGMVQLEAKMEKKEPQDIDDYLKQYRQQEMEQLDPVTEIEDPILNAQQMESMQRPSDNTFENDQNIVAHPMQTGVTDGEEFHFDPQHTSTQRMQMPSQSIFGIEGYQQYLRDITESSSAAPKFHGSAFNPIFGHQQNVTSPSSPLNLHNLEKIRMDQSPEQSPGSQVPAQVLSAQISSGADSKAQEPTALGSSDAQMRDSSESSGAAPEAQMQKASGSSDAQMRDSSESSGAAPEAQMQQASGMPEEESGKAPKISGLTWSKMKQSQKDKHGQDQVYITWRWYLNIPVKKLNETSSKKFPTGIKNKTFNASAGRTGQYYHKLPSYENIRAALFHALTFQKEQLKEEYQEKYQDEFINAVARAATKKMHEAKSTTEDVQASKQAPKIISKGKQAPKIISKDKQAPRIIFKISKDKQAPKQKHERVNPLSRK